MVLVCPKVIGEGLNEQVTSLEQEGVIVWLNDESTPAVLTVSVVEPVPITIGPDGADDETEKSASAVPFRVAVGAVVSLSVKPRAPVLLAVVDVDEDEEDDDETFTVGLKVTLMEQVAEGDRVVTQLSDSVNEPEIVTFVIVRSAVPVFVSVTVCGALLVPMSCAGKVSEEGENVATGLGVTPVPLRATVCGLPAALSVTVSVPVSAAI